MNSSFKILTAALALMFGAAACVPTPLDLEIEPMKEKLVLNASVLPNGALSLWLTKTFSALEPTGGADTNELLEKLLVEHARVRINYQGTTYTLQNMGNGVYQSDILQQLPGTVYNLLVYDSTTRESAAASAEMMTQASFRSMETVADYTATDTVIKINVTIADNPHEANYYMVNVYQVTDPQQIIATPGLTGLNQIGPDIKSASALCTDKDAASGLPAVTLDLEQFNIGDTVLVSLSNIDKQYYDYLKLREKAQNWWSELTQESINYPTNVKNGYGFFVANNPSAKAVIGLGKQEEVVVDLR